MALVSVGPSAWITQNAHRLSSMMGVEQSLPEPTVGGVGEGEPKV